MNFHIVHDAHPDEWVQVSGHRVAVRNLFCELGFSFELVTILMDTKEIPASIGPSLKGFTVVKTHEK